MEFNVDKFTALFPEFGDASKFPPVRIEIFWDLAGDFVSENGCPFSTLRGKRAETVRYYFTAHLLTLSTLQQEFEVGEEQGGFVQSATIDNITVNKLAPPASDMWGWWMAQTPYGQFILSLLEALSVGGLSVGGLPEREAYRKVGGVFF